MYTLHSWRSHPWWFQSPLVLVDCFVSSSPPIIRVDMERLSWMDPHGFHGLYIYLLFWPVHTQVCMLHTQLFMICSHFLMRYHAVHPMFDHLQGVTSHQGAHRAVSASETKSLGGDMACGDGLFIIEHCPWLLLIRFDEIGLDDLMMNHG